MLEITCPSGLRGTIRGMKVKDEQIFTDKKLSRQGKVITELLRACWLNMLDPGPYSFTSGNVNWDRVLAADRTAMLLKIRAHTYGPDYEFEVVCGSCRHRFGWGVNLDEVPCSAVSAVGLQHVKTGESIIVDMPGGYAVKIRFLTGKDEEAISSLGVQEESRVLLHNLARRVVEIGGKQEWKDVLPLVEDLESRDADHLWDVIDELEGGVDTMFKVACPKCGAQQTTMLPFETSFFSSRKRFAPGKTSASG